MKVWRLFVLVVSIVFVVAIPAAIISAVVDNLIFNAAFYHAGEVKYQVQAVTGMTQPQMDRVNAGIVRFFGSSKETLPQSLSASGANPDVFKAREIAHMNDVRGIVRLMETIKRSAIALLLVGSALTYILDSRAGVRNIARLIRVGSVATVGFVAVLGTALYFWFDPLFILFHELSFHNDYWQLDPRTDHLIQMFPFGFWFDSTKTLALRSILVAVILFAASWSLNLLARPKSRRY